MRARRKSTEPVDKWRGRLRADACADVPAGEPFARRDAASDSDSSMDVEVVESAAEAGVKRGMSGEVWAGRLRRRVHERCVSGADESMLSPHMRVVALVCAFVASSLARYHTVIRTALYKTVSVRLKPKSKRQIFIIYMYP